MGLTYFILDDEKHAVERLELLLKPYENFKHVGSETNPGKAVSFILSQRPDILFIDIEMPACSGIDFVNKVRKNGYVPVIVFITAYEKYALQAIKKAAFDYILKPIDRNELKQVLEKIKEARSTTDIQIPGNMLEKLTKREKQVFELLREGLSSKKISIQLGMAVETAFTHRRKIINKLSLESTKDIILFYPVY